MKRTFMVGSALLVAAALATGCDTSKSSTKKTEEIKDPGGTTKVETQKTVKSSGENPPLSTQGETGGNANTNPDANK